MHEAVTKSTTKSIYPTTPDDFLSPIPVSKSRPQPNSISWPHSNDSDDSESSIDNWHSQANDSSTAILTAALRHPGAGLQKLTFPSNMSSNAISSDSRITNRSLVQPQRWRVNTNGQLVDSEAASAGWLAEEIGRLKIGETGDVDDVHPTIRTPPKSQLPGSVVVQLSDASPLDTASNPSVGSSPQASDHQINISHSRGSSTDTTVSSQDSSISTNASNTLVVHPPHKVANVIEAKERPHSFSGGLTSADLRRLQHAGDGADLTDRQLHQQQQQQRFQVQYREGMAQNDQPFSPDQLSYPSIMNAGVAHRPQVQAQSQFFDYRNQAPEPQAQNTEQLQIDYNIQQRNFNPIPQAVNLPSTAQNPPFSPARQNGNPNIAPAQYRQPPRVFPQGALGNLPSGLQYGHASHLSLGSSQLYDMMVSGAPLDGHHPAVARVQQQHNVYPRVHQHSVSDPSALRDAATLALLNNNMQAFPPMFQPNMAAAAMPLYPNQFYGAQDAYSRQDVAAVAMARLQAQYSGSYGVMQQQQQQQQQQNLGLEGSVSSPTSTNGQNGPSANNRKLGLYKTELCRSWEEKGTCRYGAKCQFAHGEDEIRKVARHPKYKTEICRTFWVSGSCPYGKRCCFIHTELPNAGGPGVSSTPDNSAPSQRPDGRARSLSTNSDPNDASVSLLARITAKRGQDQNGNNTPIDAPLANSFPFTRPPTGSLRVDTSLEGPVVKQNKSAYPSFAGNGILLPAAQNIAPKSPVPVTAGPDLGRHNSSRLEIVGYNSRNGKGNASSNVRHSFSGSDGDISFTPSPPIGGPASFALNTPVEGGATTRPNGHVRGGSAGNWGSFGRSSQLSQSAYPSSPAGEINSPWSTTELAVGSSRLNENKNWA